MSKFKLGDEVKFTDIYFASGEVFTIIKELGASAGGSWTGKACYRYNIKEKNGTEEYHNVAEDNLVSAGGRSDEPKTTFEEPQGQVPADFDIVQLRNEKFYQYFKSMSGFIKITNDKAAYSCIGEDRYNLEESGYDYVSSFGVRNDSLDIMKVYRGIATDRVLTASASELKKYEVWSRPEPYVIPEKLIKAALKDFVGFEEEDIKVDEKNRFYIDGAIVGESARKFIENEEWKKKETESLWAF